MRPALRLRAVVQSHSDDLRPRGQVAQDADCRAWCARHLGVLARAQVRVYQVG